MGQRMGGYVKVSDESMRFAGVLDTETCIMLCVSN
jgi:hypothetical protein